MVGQRHLVNRAAIREAFHAQDARLPRGFIEDVEQAVQVALRRMAAGEIEPYETDELGEEIYVKKSTLKDALRDALGKTRIETSWVAHLNTLVVHKVTEAVTKRVAQTGGIPVSPMPSRVLRAFLRSEECRSGLLSIAGFHRNYQQEEYREEWETRTKKMLGRR